MSDATTMTTFYIVRHGETDWNVKKLLQGHADSVLTDTGRLQAATLGEELKHIPFDMAISSDLMRAKETAEVIVKKHELTVATTKALRERNFGKYQGQSSQILRDFIDTLQDFSQEERRKKRLDTGVESDDEVSTRVVTFLREAAILNPGKHMLIVSHSGVMRNILLHLGFMTYPEADIKQSVKNAAYFVLESDGVDFFLKETKGITVNTHGN